MAEFYPFFIVIFTGVFSSLAFRKIHVPWVVSLMLGGILIGPHVLNIVHVTPITDFISQIGIIFLMFMAGLETRLSSFRTFKAGLIWLSFINGAVPFLAGLLVSFFFGYGWSSSFLIGIIFVSSSIAAVIPSLERFGLFHTKLGQSVIVTSIIQDISSLILLSIFLQTLHPVTKLPLIVFYPLLLLILIILRWSVPKIRMFFSSHRGDKADMFQQEFRAIFLILIGIVILFEVLGLHPIIAGFFAGFILSESVTSHVLKEKIRTISYGVFIPTFFILIGIQTDISVFVQSKEALLLVTGIVGTSIISKLGSGVIGARSVGFNWDQSLLFGISSIPQLSTTLAVAFSALSFGFIDQKLITAMVILSVVTTLISPSLMAIFGERIKRVA